jgi:hypothetical protein
MVKAHDVLRLVLDVVIYGDCADSELYACYNCPFRAYISPDQKYGCGFKQLPGWTARSERVGNMIGEDL